MKPLAVQDRESGPASILVVKPSSFGDIVHTLPAVVRLKRAWPGARVAWVVNPEWSPLLAGNPCVDEVVIFPRNEFRGWRGLQKFFAWCQREISSRRPTLTVDFQGLLRSAWITRASGATYKAGLADAREGATLFYDRVIPVPGGQPHAVERYLALADGVLLSSGGAGEDDLDFPLPEGEALSSSESEKLPARYVLLHPFARGVGKSLDARQVETICHEIAPEKVVLVGKAPGPLAERWPENCVDLLNCTSLQQLIQLIRRAAAVVTVDSGPSHLAAALNRPMIAVHTWSDPRLVGPYRADAWVWKNGRLLRFQDLRGLENDFFQQRPPILSPDDLAAIARLAISF